MEYIDRIMQNYGTKRGFVKLGQVLLALIIVDIVGHFVRVGMGYYVIMDGILAAMVGGVIYAAFTKDHQIVDPVTIFIMTVQWGLSTIPSIFGYDFFLSGPATILALPVMFTFVMWVFKLQKELLPDFDPKVWVAEEVRK